MPRRTTVKTITPEVIDAAYRDLAEESPYYVRECGSLQSIPGCCLRVHRRDVFIGLRSGGKGQWTKKAKVWPHMTSNEVLVLRSSIREMVMQHQFEQEDPLAAKRQQTVRQLYEAHLEDYQVTRGDRRSRRTVEAYRELWQTHLLPIKVEVAPGTFTALEHVRINDVTPGIITALRAKIVQNVLSRGRFAKTGGQITANRALQQGAAAWDFACRQEWTTGNPWSARIVRRFDEEPDEYVLSGEDYAALGAALLEAEELLRRTRPPLSYRTIVGLRLLLFTGARMQELLQATLCRSSNESLLPYLERSPYPRIVVQRAKGDRGSMKRPAGRSIWLPSWTLPLIDGIDRPLDATDWIIPGDEPGQPLQRLNKAWRWLLKSAGISYVPPKTCRTSFRTLGPDAGVPREHMQLLLGHAGAKVTDGVYLKELAPSLSAAAEKMAAHIANLMGMVHHFSPELHSGSRVITSKSPLQVTATDLLWPK